MSQVTKRMKKNGSLPTSEATNQSSDLILNNLIFLNGEELKPLHGSITIDRSGNIKQIRRDQVETSNHSSTEEILDCSGLLAMPSFFNACCYLFESSLPDEWLSEDISKQSQIAKETAETVQYSDEELVMTTRNYFRQMLSSGTTSCLVFVGNGLRGLEITQKAKKNCGIDVHMVSVVDHLQGTVSQVISQLLEIAEGILISKVHNLSQSELISVQSLCRQKQKILCAQTGWSIFPEFQPDFWICETKLHSDEAQYLAKNNIPLISCLKSNVTFGRETPDIKPFFATGSNIHLGTGPAWLNEPNMFQELDFTTRYLLAANHGKFSLAPEKILRAAISGDLIGQERFISLGKCCDIILLQLDSALTPLQGAITVLLRGGAHQIQAVIKSGLVHGKENILKSPARTQDYPVLSPLDLRLPLPGVSFSSIQEGIEAVSRGEFVCVLDSEDRENEGDLIIATEKIDEKKMGFLVKYTSGVVCVSMLKERLEELELPAMVLNNTESHRTAFTVSVDYNKGTTTGISAQDRALTLKALIDPSSTAKDFNRPGHIFPLMYREGGVLVRNGHTEASTDLAKLANLYPSGILCEIVKEDGSMARRPYLEKFCAFFGIVMITIEDLIDYRIKNAK